MSTRNARPLDLAVIKNLTPETNAPHVLRNIARWHQHPFRRAKRNAEIARALNDAARIAESEYLREAA